ncbi:7-carboxy-7-deazaguanine synthase QueE [Roseofilum sp. BLCC_M143]|uniref:7-carboxy-7-deazaguanine synthase n=2 Tax=Roseofilum TaxID=1233426 RepID=A0ABT7BZ76_9CYAN|nr:7-carboxy-7-deazaguanine synthase QueE [Roseofilum casamattae]MDJ1184509.1 7-carboxy-7-deazaguanine synthase QueE [Roseofilum casamattae BLCC-M143]
METYPIVETFHSIQGEGYWMGQNSFFIRLGGCDVGCWFCDTKESWPAHKHPQYSVPALAEKVLAASASTVIVTGGEPLMHDLNPLTKGLKSLCSLPLHLETSGAHPFSGTFDWVTFSPKRFKLPHPSIRDRADELKVVIANAEDLQWAQDQASLVKESAIKFLQPEWNSPEATDLVFEFVLAHPDWRISLQTHKFLGVR